MSGTSIIAKFSMSLILIMIICVRVAFLGHVFKLTTINDIVPRH